MSRLTRSTSRPAAEARDPETRASKVPEPQATATLVDALRKHDPAALAELFDRYSPSIHRILVRIVGSDDPETSDLLHDTFLRAAQHVRRLRNPQALKSWLSRIAVFTAQEWLRRRKRIGHPRPPDADSERAAVSASPEAREAVRALYRILDTLPEDERVVFVLRFVERMELVEIAETCAVSFSTVRRRIKRAERRFLEALPAEPALQDRLRGPRWKVAR